MIFVTSISPATVRELIPKISVQKKVRYVNTIIFVMLNPTPPIAYFPKFK